MPVHIDHWPIRLTVDQARLAARAKIDADNFRFQNQELRQAKLAQDTTLALYFMENSALQLTVGRSGKTILELERRIRRQNRELWLYRSGLLTLLLQRFVK